jgi:anti-anti-sigma regulatory factor
VSNQSSVTARHTANGRGLVIDVVGRLGLEMHREFRNAYESSPPCERYAVNLQRCAGIDSSGLGMLLILRDFAAVEKRNMLVVNCPSRLGRLFDIAKFDRLFTIQNLSQSTDLDA